MRKMWLIARSTFWRRVRSGSFLLLTFGLPAIMVIAGAIPILSQSRARLPDLGIVDQTNRLEVLDSYTYQEDTLSFTSYPSLEAVEAAYRNGEIEAYLLVPEGYFEGERPRLYTSDEPGTNLESALEAYLRSTANPDLPGWMLSRYDDPAEFTYRSLDSQASVSEGAGLIIRVVTPVALGILFALSVFTGVSQLGSVMVREKDQRAMEIVITSIRPGLLVAGKILGMTMVSLAQLGVWSLGAAIGLGLALSGSMEFSLSIIHTQALLWAVLLGVPGYFLYATIASGLGVIAGDQQQARQLAGLLGFVGMTPLYLTGVIVSAPDSPLAIGLTLFPLTAPTFGLIRMTLTSVPVWQLTGAAVLVVISMLAGVWVVARLFRTAMLLYGQRLSASQIWRAIRQSA